MGNEEMKKHEIFVSDNGKNKIINVWANDPIDAIYTLLLEKTGIKIKTITALNAKELFQSVSEDDSSVYEASLKAIDAICDGLRVPTVAKDLSRGYTTLERVMLLEDMYKQVIIKYGK